MKGTKCRSLDVVLDDVLDEMSEGRRRQLEGCSRCWSRRDGERREDTGEVLYHKARSRFQSLRLHQTQRVFCCIEPSGSVSAKFTNAHSLESDS